MFNKIEYEQSTVKYNSVKTDIIRNVWLSEQYKIIVGWSRNFCTFM